MGDEVRNTLKKQERLSSGISLSRLLRPDITGLPILSDIVSSRATD